MSAPEKEALIQELFPIQNRIFSDTQIEDFRQFILAPKAYKTRLRRFYNAHQELVGYICFHAFAIQGHKQQRQTVFKTEVGLLPAYRGKNKCMSFLVGQCVKEFFLAGAGKAWFVASPVHPNPYCLAGEQLFRIYPSPHQETPPQVQDLATQFARDFGYQPGQHPGTFQINWQVQESNQQSEKLRQSPNPWVQHYLHLNPDYQQGCGFIMMVPMVPMNLFSSLGNIVLKKYKKMRLKWVSKLTRLRLRLTFL